MCLLRGGDCWSVVVVSEADDFCDFYGRMPRLDSIESFENVILWLNDSSRERTISTESDIKDGVPISNNEGESLHFLLKSWLLSGVFSSSSS